VGEDWDGALTLTEARGGVEKGEGKGVGVEADERGAGADGGGEE
jgi:hypothetical protein